MCGLEATGYPVSKDGNVGIRESIRRRATLHLFNFRVGGALRWHTTDEVVSKTRERWRVLETEEAPSLSKAIPLVAQLNTCRFSQHEIGCRSSGTCKMEPRKEIRTQGIVLC